MRSSKSSIVVKRWVSHEPSFLFRTIDQFVYVPFPHPWRAINGLLLPTGRYGIRRACRTSVHSSLGTYFLFVFQKAFHEFNVENTPYLALRNLIVTLWTINPFKYLSLSDCLPYIVCRGLSRIWHCELAKRVHSYLEMKGAINFGILEVPKPLKQDGSKVRHAYSRSKEVLKH